MTHDGLLALSGLAIAMAVVGLVFGWLYFAAVRRSVALLLGGGHWFWSLALTLGRIAAAGVFLLVAAHLGAASLLAALIGFLAARSLALRAAGRTR
jgi:hypothetical protein